MSAIEEFMEIKKTLEELSTRKIRLEERFSNIKSNLEKLIQEITAKGYDPKKLTEIKREKQEKIEKALKELMEKSEEINKKLSTIEANQ